MRRPRIPDEEWMALINECRTSGMSDKAWCEAHNIHPSLFYYHIKRLRDKSCKIPTATGCLTRQQSEKQEVVAIDFSESTLVEQTLFQNTPISQTLQDTNVAIRINLKGIHLEISNYAAQDIIFHTLSALQKLC